MNFILASTSTLAGQKYLEYLRPALQELFAGVTTITFIPFARPGGISLEDYTQKAADFFQTMDKKVVGLHTYSNPQEALKTAEGFFTGGGNTFLLVKTLHELNLMDCLAAEVKQGKPYLGCSAGSNIGGLTMKTTNDMPIVYPPSFDCMGLVPFNLNPHYFDGPLAENYAGETRDTRIQEFLTQNDTTVVGLREGNWIRGREGKLTIEGTEKTKIFMPGQSPFEVEPQYVFPDIVLTDHGKVVS